MGYGAYPPSGYDAYGGYYDEAGGYHAADGSYSIRPSCPRRTPRFRLLPSNS